MSLSTDRDKLQTADKRTLYKRIRRDIDTESSPGANLCAPALYPGVPIKLIARFKGG